MHLTDTECPRRPECRLYDPTAGGILPDGIDIREFDPDELRAQVGAMFQDYVIYQAMAKENIGLGSLPELEDHDAVCLELRGVLRARAV
jgi:ATP-binding cassette subfamily B protein